MAPLGGHFGRDPCVPAPFPISEFNRSSRRDLAYACRSKVSQDRGAHRAHLVEVLRPGFRRALSPTTPVTVFERNSHPAVRAVCSSCPLLATRFRSNSSSADNQTMFVDTVFDAPPGPIFATRWNDDADPKLLHYSRLPANL